MFIKSLSIKNFRIFSVNQEIIIDEFNIPDGSNPGSGITVFVGENGCGKTSILDALSFPLLSYKSDLFSIDDFNSPKEKSIIQIHSSSDFEYSGTMPKAKYRAKGFLFEAGLRAKATKAYLSSMVVSDQKFIKADGESKPADGSPDLRVSVNNPFSGKRFDENDVLYLDKNRTFQTRSGTYNQTRFDRLMEDFNFQHIKNFPDEIGIEAERFENAIKSKLENNFLAEAIRTFKNISGFDLRLNIVNGWKPFESGFFSQTNDNKMQVNLNKIGSGYEMIFSLIYSFYLSKQSGKKLIALIDEPELHLHPMLQNKFLEFLLETSREAQIFLTTHSPLFIKQLLQNKNAIVRIVNVDNGVPKIQSLENIVLPYVSSNEINYLAFNLATEEYHNELYEALLMVHGEGKGIKDFDGDYFVKKKGELANSPWRGKPSIVSVHTFIRNQIHHRCENGAAKYSDLLCSIKKMRGFIIRTNS